MKRERLLERPTRDFTTKLLPLGRSTRQSDEWIEAVKKPQWRVGLSAECEVPEF